MLKRGEYDVLILDNFSTLADIEDENSASAMSPVLNFLLNLKQRRVAAILIHHANKPGKGFRGSSKLSTTFEVILALTKPVDAVLHDGLRFEISWEKFRGKTAESTTGAKVWLEDHEGNFKWVREASENVEC